MVFLPVWAIFYVGMLEPPPSDELVLADNGAAVYSTCASCHGADGSGTATGRQLNGGELLLTFGSPPNSTAWPTICPGCTSAPRAPSVWGWTSTVTPTGPVASERSTASPAA